MASLSRNGFGENLVTGVDVSDKDTQAARLTLGYFPASDKYDVKIELDHTIDASGVRGAQMLATNRFDPAVPDTLPLDDRYDVRSGLYPDNSTTSSGAALTATWRATDDWTLKSISAWRKSDTETSIDFDTLPAQLTDVHAGYHDKQLSQEFQASYDAGGKSTGVFGIYAFDGKPVAWCATSSSRAPASRPSSRTRPVPVSRASSAPPTGAWTPRASPLRRLGLCLHRAPERRRRAALDPRGKARHGQQPVVRERQLLGAHPDRRLRQEDHLHQPVAEVQPRLQAGREHAAVRAVGARLQVRRLQHPRQHPAELAAAL
jgi:hypothetical protein